MNHIIERCPGKIEDVIEYCVSIIVKEARNEERLDTQDNKPQKTMITREKEVLVAVVDIESGTWKMAREIFEVLQKEMASQKRTISEINIQSIQELATDIGARVKNTSNIRGKTARIQNLIEKYKLEIDEELDEIKDAVDKHQKKLMAAVAGIENEKKEALSMTQRSNR